MSERLAKTPEAPYYAVVFTSRLSDTNPSGYDEMAGKMVDLAINNHGCLGVENVRDAEGVGITVSYWKDEESIKIWKADTQHLAAQRQGMEKWYSQYELRVARVERAYSGPDGRSL